MSEKWDGYIVMSADGRPTINMSLGEYLSRKGAEIKQLTRERDEARYFLKIFIHAHASNNAVPPHIEQQAREALEEKS